MLIILGEMILILMIFIKVINFFGLRDNLTEYLDLLNNCDSDGSQESKVFQFTFLFSSICICTCLNLHLYLFLFKFVFVFICICMM